MCLFDMFEEITYIVKRSVYYSIQGINIFTFWFFAMLLQFLIYSGLQKESEQSYNINILHFLVPFRSFLCGNCRFTLSR